MYYLIQLQTNASSTQLKSDGAISFRMRDQYMAGEKYWKISPVVMDITSENIRFIMSGQRL